MAAGAALGGCGSNRASDAKDGGTVDAAKQPSTDAGVDASGDGSTPRDSGRPDSGAHLDSAADHEAGITPPLPCPSLAPNVACAGDGVTDDTSCLATALASGTPNVVLVAGKTYLISASLKLPANTALLGNEGTLLSQGPSMLSFVGDSSSICGVHFVQMGMAADAPVVNVNAGLQHVSFRNSTLTSDSAPIGIYIAPGGPTAYVLIQGNSLSGTHYPILLNAGGQGTSLSNYAHDITIDQNSISDAGVDAIEINSPVMVMGGSGVAGVAVNHVTITHNNLTNQGEFGIGLAGVVNGLVSGNIIDHTGVPPGSKTLIEGIHLEDHAADVTIVGNRISNTMGVSADDSAITLLVSNHISIFDNVVDTTTTGSGIELSYDPEGDFDSDCVIAGNRISSSGAYGIFVGGESGEAVDTQVGPSGKHGGNVTKSSGLAGNQAAGKGSIQASAGVGIVVIGNSGD